MTVEFDRKCGTAQIEDSLQLYVPAAGFHSNPPQSTIIRLEYEVNSKCPYWPILKRYRGTENWPTFAVVVPGSFLFLFFYSRENEN